MAIQVPHPPPQRPIEVHSHITQRMLYRLGVGEPRSVPLDFRQLITVTKAYTLKQRLQGAAVGAAAGVSSVKEPGLNGKYRLTIPA